MQTGLQKVLWFNHSSNHSEELKGVEVIEGETFKLFCTLDADYSIIFASFVQALYVPMVPYDSLTLSILQTTHLLFVFGFVAGCFMNK